MIVEHSEVPRPVNEDNPRYYHYRNAQDLGNGLYEVELGMGVRPKVWTLAFLVFYDNRYRIKAWMRRTRGDRYGATVIPNFDEIWRFGTIVEGKHLTKEDAERMLRALCIG